MNWKNLMLFLALGALTLQSCDEDDDDNGTAGSAVIESAFKTKFPEVKTVKWETKGEYKVAGFVDETKAKEAWFDSKGQWYMTETDVTYQELPAPVKQSFETGYYAAWKIEDIDKLERKDIETIYKIEVEKLDKEVDLIYNAAGVLVKKIEETDDNTVSNNGNLLPAEVPSSIEAIVKQQYPQAVIVDIDYEKDKIEVDIVHNNIGKEVVFNLQKQWVQTSWEVLVLQVPAKVMETVQLEVNKDGYYIDDVDYVETPTANYYLFELEKGKLEMYLKVDLNGIILK